LYLSTSTLPPKGVNSVISDGLINNISIIL